MDSDRELLEWAAKAVCYKTDHRWNAERITMKPPIYALYVMNEKGVVHTAWNPLKNGEQALQLAVKLNLIVRPGMVMLTEYGPGFGEDTSIHPYDATLRAIVRAAAEIGKSKHEPKPD